MPATVRSLMATASLERHGVVGWRESVVSRAPGVYVVTLTADPNTTDGTHSSCPISLDAVDGLLQARPELRVDGTQPDAQNVADRVSSFWLSDEVILYIGLAGTSLNDRIGHYYRTPLGARRPHAGGWFLKLLSDLDGLHVHFAECDDPGPAEDMMLGAFVQSVSTKTRSRLRDPEHPFPFANLEWPKGIRKNHGITGATEPRRPKSSSPKGPTEEYPASDTVIPRTTPAPSNSGIDAINSFLQAELKRRNLDQVTAVAAAQWLDDAGLLQDSQRRPGLPLRELLRADQIDGQRQESNRRWFIHPTNSR